MTEEQLMVISDITEDELIRVIKNAIEEGKNYGLEIYSNASLAVDFIYTLEIVVQAAATKAIEEYMKGTGQL